MAVARKQRDQGEQAGGEHRDPALKVESKDHGNQTKPPIYAQYTSTREALGNDVLTSPNSAQMFDLNKFANPEPEISRFLLISA